MTITINIPKTAEQCAALLEHIQSGEEILLAQGGIAIARVVPISSPTQPRIPGQDKGKVAIASDFNALEKILARVTPQAIAFCLTTPKSLFLLLV